MSFCLFEDVGVVFSYAGPLTFVQLKGLNMPHDNPIISSLVFPMQTSKNEPNPCWRWCSENSFCPFSWSSPGFLQEVPMDENENQSRSIFCLLKFSKTIKDQGDQVYIYSRASRIKIGKPRFSGYSVRVSKDFLLRPIEQEMFYLLISPGSFWL